MCNFWPLSIASKGDDEIQFVVFSCNGDCILKVLVYIYLGVEMMDGGMMTFHPDLI